MAPLLRELLSLEVEPLEIVESVPSREGFYTVRSQDSSLDTLTPVSGIAGILAGKGAFPANDNCCCCCVICCCGCG